MLHVQAETLGWPKLIALQTTRDQGLTKFAPEYLLVVCKKQCTTATGQNMPPARVTNPQLKESFETLQTLSSAEKTVQEQTPQSNRKINKTFQKGNDKTTTPKATKRHYPSSTKYILKVKISQPIPMAVERQEKVKSMSSHCIPLLRRQVPRWHQKTCHWDPIQTLKTRNIHMLKLAESINHRGKAPEHTSGRGKALKRHVVAPLLNKKRKIMIELAMKPETKLHTEFRTLSKRL